MDGGISAETTGPLFGVGVESRSRVLRDDVKRVRRTAYALVTSSKWAACWSLFVDEND